MQSQHAMAEEGNTERKHFVLVHGLCHGAWCWYKLKSLLESEGHKVTALDLTGCGSSTKTIEQVQSFSEYSEPLLELLNLLLDPNEKVVLVGHSFGGLSIALAMDRFPQNIAVGVFLTAIVPDTLHKPTYFLEKYEERNRNERKLDTQVSSYGGKKFLLVDPNIMATRLYQLCSKEDLELAKSLVRPGSTFTEELSQAQNFSREGYGSVPRAYIVCNEDMATSVEFQKWMIQNAAIDEVHEIKGADHMAMLSKPQELCSTLLDIADKHASQVNVLGGFTLTC